ncbi:Uncharacterised protein [Streptococcus pneumoniae]|nr:Uncharacterised protein [Streptococcus pneumoniae]
MKISSPKNQAVFSAAAAFALIFSLNFSGSLPYLPCAAPSAIGATSGLTVCACPPILSPSAADDSLIVKYDINTLPVVAPFDFVISASALSFKP